MSANKGAVISQGILRSFCKGCGASAKDTAHKMQRWGRIAKVGYKRKEKVGCNRKDFPVRCGQNAKESALRQFRESVERSIVKADKLIACNKKRL